MVLPSFHFSISYILSSTHDSNIELSVTGTNVIPIHKINMGKLTAIQLSVFDGHGLAAAEKDAA